MTCPVRRWPFQIAREIVTTPDEGVLKYSLELKKEIRRRPNKKQPCNPHKKVLLQPPLERAYLQNLG